MDNKDFIVCILTKDNVASEIEKERDKLLLIIPELKAMIGFEHCHPHHHLNVWEHTLLALSHSKNQLKTRISLLLHDIGKPFCYQQDGEIRHYRGHGATSAELAKAILERLCFHMSFIDSITEIVRRHDEPLRESDIAKAPELSREIFEVQRCDALAHNPLYNEKRMAYIDKINAMLNN